MIGTHVTLSSDELAVVRFMATQRDHNNRFVPDKFQAPTSSVKTSEASWLGVAAEFAFCKLFNIFPDLAMHNEKHSSQGTDDGDCSYQGQRIDVKNTHYINGKLMIVPWKKPSCFAYALMVGKPPTYVFKGFFKASEAITPARLQIVTGTNKAYVVHQHELKEFNQL